MIPVEQYLAESARRRPDAPALVGGDRIGYAALDQRARRFAGALHRSGVGAGDRVALLLPKSRDGVTAIYGALYAGCAYVPLDPVQPPARAHTILADAEPRALVTDREHLGALLRAGPLPSLAVVVLVDAVDGELDAPCPLISLGAFLADAAPAEPAARGPDDLSILLYTSGSTGVPKGVQISARNLHTFLSWAANEMDLRATDVFASHAGFHFDLSTFDLYAAARVGAAVWLVPEDQARAPALLSRGIEEHGVTVWYSVPAVLSLLLAAGGFDGRAAQRLRYVLFAGEVLPIKHLRALRERLPAAALYNLYGPTETNVCTYYRVEDIAPDRDSPVPIGRPIDGVEAWMDGDGEIGELVIAGSGVTPGYWRRPELSRACGHDRGVHATGDLVSLEDGAYVYRGRKDRMVKLSGFRVELGEIEAALLRHPSIAEAAVVAAPGEDGTRLVAFYSAAPGVPGVSVLQMKQHCREHLPRYMIPHGLTRLDPLPRNANGKIDAAQLARLAAGSGAR